MTCETDHMYDVKGKRKKWIKMATAEFKIICIMLAESPSVGCMLQIVLWSIDISELKFTSCESRLDARGLTARSCTDCVKMPTCKNKMRLL